MTITLTYNESVPVVLWLLDPQAAQYIMVVESKATHEQSLTTIDNISNDINQYALFNIIAVETEEASGGNKIYLPKKGEYHYYIYVDGIHDDNLVGYGLLINSYDTKSDTIYDTNKNKIVYGK